VTGREPLLLLIVGAVLLGLSGIGPHDRTTWLLEIAPILIATPILVVTARRFPLTPLAYRLIFVHALILIVGGHYTYAEVPAGFWMERALGLARNPYDRLGHFAQGFVPAIVVREVLIRRSPLEPGKWLTFLALCVCLAISALYELVEWWATLIGGEGAEAFLGTQGDQWDTQWDMFLALVGAATALLVLARRHDRQIARVEETSHV
jgi:putative membrane protein